MKHWYVLQVHAGYEERVKKDILTMVVKEGLDEYFGDVLVPSTKLKGLFSEMADARDQQLFPGYVLIEMEFTPETACLVEGSPRVIKFLGGTPPTRVAAKEISRIMSQVKGEIKVAVERDRFVVGQEVEVVDGPFVGFMGVVDKIDREGERLTVMVSIFGRMTPVELGFNQVK